MKNKFNCLLAAVAILLGAGGVTAQNIVKAPIDNQPGAPQAPTNQLSVERPATTINNGGAVVNEENTWQTDVYGEGWQSDAEKISRLLPEFASGNGIPATDADRVAVAALPIDVAQNVTRAIEKYYLALEKMSYGYAGRKFEIIGARRIDNYILLWIDEPEIRDGGRAIIYGGGKDRIVAEFSDGGIRG
ncbi:MAG TPA: hypothetical protein PLM07_13160 [Candidatus Rifleibacterium sp.]|nr:hypothetical protein [Candidatus Rifleibacterium sp.]HPT46834.1 hypothetical protein [Candidatus Rifleibacterium sp.]